MKYAYYDYCSSVISITLITLITQSHPSYLANVTPTDEIYG